jgi:hypothetical protein
MVEMSCRIFERSRNILVLDVWEIRKYIGPAGAAGQQLKNIGHPYSLTADAGPASANIRIGTDTIEVVLHARVAHCICIFGPSIANDRDIRHGVS